MSLTLKELDSFLFECADIIRNTVSISDYKNYILPLVLYKTINDTYKDEYEKAKEEYGEEAAKDESLHEFQLPEDYTWVDAKKVDDNLGKFLDEAFKEISGANPDKLSGIRKPGYEDVDGLTDDVLKDLLKHLEKHNLSIKEVPPDILGEGYMDLVKHFASQEGRDGGEFFTPPHIVELMVKLLAPFEDGDEFHDPTVGSGSMLTEAAKYYSEVQGKDPKDLKFTGQEINPDIAMIAKINLILHELNGQIKREDSLRNPMFKEDGDLKKFDYVLSNFPFSANWAKDDLKNDKFNRFNWADRLPRKDRGDYAFIMHMVAQLKEDGQLAVVIPHGVLFRKHENKFRKPMLEEDIVEAVIGLPENLFQNNAIPSAILVFNKNKPEERKNKVQFIHAADEEFYEELSNQNQLTDEGVEHIANNFNEWKNEERVSRTVDLDEIAENDYNLNIALYVDTTEPEEKIDVEKELEKYYNLKNELKGVEKTLENHMEALKYEIKNKK